MDLIDGTEHVEEKQTGEIPSLLTIILDTNPAAWSLLSDALPLSSVVANVLVFINAHLACNYTNKVAAIASHCDKAEYLYPTPTKQLPPGSNHSKRQADDDPEAQDNLSEPTKRLKLNGPNQNGTSSTPLPSSSSGNKYRPFRLIESELLTNLTTLLTSTSPSSLQTSTSTLIAGALTLALSYINRESIAYSESLTGVASTSATDTLPNATTNNENNKNLQSRILLLTASPSTDLAHQYIPIMNAVFACQRLSIPIDILQFPLPNTTTTPSSTSTSSANSTVFLQQASDATSGIFIPFQFPIKPTPTKSIATLASESLLTYLLTSLLPSPNTRLHLILPTRIDVDFRAACFCHRRVIDIGFVCSICLSIFCSPPEGGECLTCGNVLSMGKEAGRKPVVVARKKKKKKRREGAGSGEGMSRVGTPSTAWAVEDVVERTTTQRSIKTFESC